MTKYNKYNLILVIDKQNDAILMCKRTTNPEKGKYNFVGGKVNQDETDLQAAYRELYEETGIAQNNIDLKELTDLYYEHDNSHLKVYYGYIKGEIELIEEKHPLNWHSLRRSSFDDSEYASHIKDLINQLNSRI